MSIAVFLAIETCLQLFDRSAGQHQRVMLQDVIDVGADRRQHIDADEVRARAWRSSFTASPSMTSSFLPQTELGELTGQNLGLGVLHIEAVDDVIRRPSPSTKAPS
jgi:hypothetical protein